jgi:hypothetical protein
MPDQPGDGKAERPRAPAPSPTPGRPLARNGSGFMEDLKSKYSYFKQRQGVLQEYL